VDYTKDFRAGLFPVLEKPALNLGIDTFNHPLVLLFAYYFYRKEKASASLPVKLFLALIRCCLIFLVLIIIFEPVLLLETEIERQSNLVVLIDESMSMGF